MYKIIQSNKLIELARRMLEQHGMTDLFTPRPLLVVQNKQMEEWIKIQAARENGIFAYGQFEFPDRAVRSLLDGFEISREILADRKILFMDDLKVILYKILEEEMSSVNSPLGVLKRYSRSENADLTAARLYALCDRIAGLFYHYSMNCSPLVELWETGKMHGGHPEEPWQAYLWRRLYRSDYTHLGQILKRIQDSEERYQGEYSEIILFGSAFLSENSFSLFHRISEEIPVYQYLLSPSEAYNFGEAEMVVESPLSLWGDVMKGFCLGSAGYSLETERCFQTTEDVSDLTSLQQILLTNSPERKPSGLVWENDGSLQIISCSGRQREIEILYDQILRDLRDDPQLQLTDIGVLAPDIDAYQASIESCFGKGGEGGGLPHNVMDLGMSRQSSFIQGFLLLLDFYNARMSRDEVFRFLDNPCVMERFVYTTEDRDLWLDFCVETHTFWGADGEHRRKKGWSETGENSWEEAFSRLLASSAGSSPVYPCPASEEGILRVFPVDRSAARSSLGKLITIVRGLYSDFGLIEGLRMHIEAWIFLLERMMDSYLAVRKDVPEDKQARVRIKDAFRRILNLSADLEKFSSFSDPSFDYGFVRSVLKEMLQEKRMHRGNYLTGGITFSSIKPMRAIPFSHLYVLGLNEKDFPGKEEPLSFDLRKLIPQSIDLSRKNTDLYSFLETFMSATQKLGLFFLGQNPVTGEVMNPSPVITDVLEAIERGFQLKGSVQQLIERHPLQPFHQVYFTEDRFTFSENRARMARAFYSESIDFPAVSLEIPPEQEIPSRLEWFRLLSFLKDQLKVFCQNRAGILSREEDLLDREVHEPMEPGMFDEWPFLKEALAENRFDTADFLQDSRSTGLLSRGILGENYREKWEEMMGRLEESVESRRDGRTPTLMRFSEDGDSPGCRPLVLPSGFTLYGDLPVLYTAKDGVYFHFFPCYSSDPYARHYLESYLVSLMLTVQAGVPFQELYACPVGYRDYPSVSMSPRPAQAEHFLEELVAGYFANLQQPVPLNPEGIKGLKKLDQLKEVFLRSIPRLAAESRLTELSGRSYGWKTDQPWVRFLLEEFYPDMLKEVL